MAFIPGDRVVQVDVVMRWQGEKVENTLYFKKGTAVGGTDVDTLCADVGGWWETNMMPIMSETVSLFVVEGRDLTAAESFVGSYSPSGAVVGGLTGDSVTNNTTLSVSFRTGYAGRSFRGRNYWVGLIEANVANNVVAPAQIAAILAAYDGMVGDEAVSAGFTWGVFSRYSNNLPRVAGQFQAITNAVIVDNVVDSQRRRLPGRGQ